MKFTYMSTLLCFFLFGCSGQEPEEEELDKIVYLEEDKGEWSLPEESVVEELVQTIEETSFE